MIRSVHMYIEECSSSGNKTFFVYKVVCVSFDGISRGACLNMPVNSAGHNNSIRFAKHVQAMLPASNKIITNIIQRKTILIGTAVCL